MSAVRHAGPGAALGGATAARIHGAWDRGVAKVEVVVGARGFRGTRRAGYCFTRRSEPRSDPDVVDPIGPLPVLNALEACLDMARSHTPLQIAFVIRRFEYLGKFDRAALRGFVAAAANLPGVPVLRAALALVGSGSAGTRSGAEDLVHEQLRRIGIAPDAVNVRGCTGLVGDEADFVWFDQRANLEIDGGHHDDPDQRRADEDRDAALVALGWRVLRIRSWLVHRSASAVARHVREWLVAADRTDRRQEC